MTEYLIDRADLYNQIKALADICGKVDSDLDEGRVELQQIRYPAGWTPRFGTIIYRLPPTFDREQPRAFMPIEMEYRGSSPRIKLDHRGPDHLAEHCIREWKGWTPGQDTVVTFTRYIYQSLKHPNSANPIQDHVG
jgi:hypothetical protein